MNLEDIKYKALNIKTKTISNVINIICDWDGNIGEIETNEEDGITYSLDNNIVLLPYTGFKDKNGTEIYEGDIVRIDSDILDIDPMQSKYIIDKQFMSFGARIPNREENNFLLNCEFELAIHEKRVTVIGNVWENPELLK